MRKLAVTLTVACASLASAPLAAAHGGPPLVLKPPGSGIPYCVVLVGTFHDAHGNAISGGLCVAREAVVLFPAHE